MAINVDIKPKTILQALEDIANAISGGDSGGGGSSGGGGVTVFDITNDTVNQVLIVEGKSEDVMAACMSGNVVFKFTNDTNVMLVSVIRVELLGNAYRFYTNAIDDSARIDYFYSYDGQDKPEYSYGHA